MAIHDRILLATDLGARSDRAMDRAIMLAKRKNSELVVLHVIEPTPDNRYYVHKQSLSSLAAIVRAQLIHDLGDCAAKAQVRIEEGDPAAVIERVAREQASTLVVVGVARVERLGRFVLGKTVERLVRRLETPLLVVTDRPRAPYQRVCVAVDFTSVSRQALELTIRLFPDQRITAFHAYQTLASYAAPDLDQHRADFREIASSNFEKWLEATGMPPEQLQLVTKRVELGDASEAVREAAAHGEFDLVVIGTRGRDRIFEFFIGSAAKQILAELPCDALLVHDLSVPAAG